MPLLTCRPVNNLIAAVPDTIERRKPSPIGAYQEGRAACKPGKVDGIERFIPRRGLYLLDTLQQSFTELGGTVSDAIFYETGTTDFGSALTLLDERIGLELGLHDRKNIAVFDEGVSLMDQARTGRYKYLDQVAWNGTDGLAENTRFKSRIAAFAASHDFTCPIYSVTSPGHVSSYSIPKMVITEDVAEKASAQPIQYAYTAWDALWLGAISLLESDWSPNVSVLEQTVSTASQKYIGLSNFDALDNDGDKKYWDYDFFRIEKSKGSFEWKVAATGHYHPTLYLVPTM